MSERARSFLEPRTLLVVVGLGAVTAFAFAACSDGVSGATPGGGGGGAGGGGDLFACEEGEQACDEEGRAVTCGADGTFGDPRTCGAGETCFPFLGCSTCDPSTVGASCQDGEEVFCFGGDLQRRSCDGPGATCEAGGCEGPCAPSKLLDRGNVGCEFYPTVTMNIVDDAFDFAVAVTAEDADTTVEITRGGEPVVPIGMTEPTFVVPKGEVKIVQLPWVADLKGPEVDQCLRPQEPGATRVVAGGAYRLVTDHPVAVYQFSPLSYTIEPPPETCNVPADHWDECCAGSSYCIDYCGSFANDASLLLPANQLTGNYLALAWNSGWYTPATMTVTATQDGTQVTLDGKGAFVAGAGITADGRGTVTLNRGDVLEIVSRNTIGDGAGRRPSFDDPSGSVLRADKPIQVIAGHACANVPEYGQNEGVRPTGYCDHLEDSLFPLEALGREYFVTVPAKTQDGLPPQHVIRIAAAEPAKVKLDPPVDGVAEVELDASRPFVQLTGVTTDVRVTADKPILVAQLMQGSTSLTEDPVNEPGPGDPSIAFAIPKAQYRDHYAFVASKTYYSNYVNVVAETGATVTVDGTKLGPESFTPIGSTGWGIARHVLSKATDAHAITSPSRFGITVYGYGKDTSYMYAGGLDLQRIAPPPPK